MYKLVGTLILVITHFYAFGQDSLQFVLENAKRPSVENFYIKIDDDQDHSSSIPISVIKGKENGPVFSIISGVHGFEYSSIMASHELLQELNPELLSGTIIIVPLSNPDSFYGRSPFVNPQDQLNLNRVFPGSKTGSATERIAHYITTEIIARSDIFIDMHGGDASEDLLSFIGFYNNKGQQEQTEKIKKLAEVTGFKYIVSWPYNLQKDQPAKYAFKQAVQDGKIALIIEAGKLGNVQKEAVNMIKNAIYNMLAELKIYKVEKKVNPDFINMNKQTYIKSEHTGIFFSDYAAGDSITKGDRIGLIKNEFGELMYEIKAPNSGIILYKIGTPPVNVGETIMCIVHNQ